MRVLQLNHSLTFSLRKTYMKKYFFADTVVTLLPTRLIVCAQKGFTLKPPPFWATPPPLHLHSIPDILAPGAPLPRMSDLVSQQRLP